jgi:chemotaxis protein MotB
MKFRSRLFNNKEKEENFWPSFVDIMTTVSLVFFMIMIMVMLSILKQYKEVVKLNHRIDNISEMRSKLYKDLGTEIEKSSLKDSVDYNVVTGELSIKADLIFDSGKYNLKPQTVQIGEQLRSVIGTILGKYWSKILYFEIIGHTDMEDNGEYNRKLSLNRAMVFTNVLVPKDSKFEAKYGSKIKPAGMSEFEPKQGKINKQSPEDMRVNRRIEVKIVYDDSDIKKAVDEYLKLTDLGD